MIALNVNTLGDFPEDLIMAKMDIETKMIEDGVITEKQPFQEFISTLSLQDCVYMKGRDVIPFKFVEGKRDSYLVYVNDDTKHKDVYEELLKRLQSVNYDVTKFVKQDIDMMLKHDLDKDQLFIINGHYYQ